MRCVPINTAKVIRDRVDYSDLKRIDMEAELRELLGFEIQHPMSRTTMSKTAGHKKACCSLELPNRCRILFKAVLKAISDFPPCVKTWLKQCKLVCWQLTMRPLLLA